MVYNSQALSTIYPLTKTFVFHVMSYREIFEASENLPGDKEFWTYTSDAHFQMAIITWCKIFGTDENQTHWKRLELDENEFREVIYSKLGISFYEWHEYRKAMIRFRNEYVAHTMLDSLPTPPLFDNAINVVILLNAWVREKIRPDTFSDKPFDKLIEDWVKKIRSTVELICSNKTG